MTNTYRAISQLAEYRYGADTCELDLSVEEERDLVGNGHLALVPRKYRVLVDNYQHGAKDSEIEAALLREIEAALVSGGVLERVEPKHAKPEPPAAEAEAEPAAEAKPTTKKAAKKSG